MCQNFHTGLVMLKSQGYRAFNLRATTFLSLTGLLKLTLINCFPHFLLFALLNMVKYSQNVKASFTG